MFLNVKHKQNALYCTW